MISWKLYRARAAWVLANLIVVAGFLAVMPLVLRPLLPGVEATPLLLVAAGGLAAMLMGSAIASRQARVLDTYRNRRADALRRVHHYRNDARIEPTLGPRESPAGTAPRGAGP